MLKLDARTNEELIASTAYICSDTGGHSDAFSHTIICSGARLDKIEHLSFAPQRTDPIRYPQIILKSEDVMNVKAEDAKPGIHILGFQSIAALKDYHQLCPALFVYPDETKLKGSMTTFIALHETMLRSESLAICCYSRTQKAQPRIVALLPQRETLDKDGRQVRKQFCKF